MIVTPASVLAAGFLAGDFDAAGLVAAEALVVALFAGAFDAEAVFAVVFATGFGMLFGAVEAFTTVSSLESPIVPPSLV